MLVEILCDKVVMGFIRELSRKFDLFGILGNLVDVMGHWLLLRVLLMVSGGISFAALI